MNKVILMGNLTRDPEIRYSQGENSLAIARFSLAVNRRFARQGDTDVDFFNCTAFGKQGEFVEKYFKQGSRMLLIGHVQNNNYTNKNGEKVYGVQIIAEEVEFAERKGNGQGQQNQNQQQGYSSQGQNGQGQQGSPNQGHNQQNQSYAASQNGQQNQGYSPQGQNGQQQNTGPNQQGQNGQRNQQASPNDFNGFPETDFDDFGFGEFADESMFGG